RDRFRVRKWRLARQLTRDRGVRSAVVGDAVPAAQNRIRPRAIGEADARSEVIGVRVQQTGGERAGEWTDGIWKYGRGGGEARRHVEIRHPLIQLDVRPRQLVAQ